MSYILDALKRADAERERGHVPGLHSQRVPSAVPKHTGSWQGRPALTLKAGAAAALLTSIAAIGWWVSTSDGRSETPETAAPVAETPAIQPPPQVPPAELTETPPAPPALPILAPAPAPAPAAAPVPVTTPSARPAVGEPGAPGEPSVEPPAAASPTVTTTNAPDLPPPRPQTAGQHPAISISGSTYSSNPAHRMLIVNGNVVREGQAVSPGLVLESITPRSAVFNHNGTRFNVNF